MHGSKPGLQLECRVLKFSAKLTSTGAQAHALFDADAARSCPAFSLTEPLYKPLAVVGTGSSEALGRRVENLFDALSTERWMARLPT